MERLDAVKRIVQGGMRVMYSKEGRKMLIAGLQGNQPPEQKLALEVVGLIKILYDKSNKTMPPEAIPAASALLVYETADFMKKAGAPVTVAQIQAALIATLKLLRVAFSKEIGAAKAKAGQATAAPTPPVAQPPAPAGSLISQAQGA